MLRSCATACSMILRSSPACLRQAEAAGDQISRQISRQAEAVAQSPILGIGPRHTEAHSSGGGGASTRRRRPGGAVRVHTVRSRRP